MKRVYFFPSIIITSVIFLILFTTPSFSFFVKYPQNPIFNVSTLGWDNSHVAASNITLLDGVYTLWYGGHNGTRWNIGNATNISTDGINWIKNPLNPLVTYNLLDPQDQHVHTPSVIKDNDGYHMWYTSSPNDTSNFRIRYVTSNDAVTWTKHPSPVIFPSQTWENQGVADPYVLKIGGTFHMWYAGINSGEWKIGYATSTDGIIWTKSLANPILTGTLQEHNIGAPSVTYENNIFTMYYHGGPTGIPTMLFRATSLDGIDWTRDSSNPILVTGGFVAFDRLLVAYPDVIRVANKLRLYYSGHDGAKWRIGLAEEKVPVPYFAQDDPEWGNDEYDSASDWAPPNPNSNSAWACALTSAAMILKHFNVQKTPGDHEMSPPLLEKDLTPGNLNEWLNSQPDGYIGGGRVNWVALSRMTKLAHDLDPTSPKLEYFASPAAELSNVLTNDLPAILNLPEPDSPSNTHFVVATDSANLTYAIQDPLHEDYKTLTPNYGSINRIGYYQPTNSDFSYFVIHTNQEVDMSLFDSANMQVGQAYLENPLGNDLGVGSSGLPLRMLLLKAPSQGQYALNLFSPNSTPFDLHVYLYDHDGKVKIEQLQGNLLSGKIQKFWLTFDGVNVQNSTLETNYDLFRRHINELYRGGKIKMKMVYQKLLYEANKVEAMAKKGPTGVNVRLEGVLRYIETRRGKFLTEEAYQILKTDVMNLLSQF